MSNENGLYYATNSGALLRKIFPNHLKTQGMIIIWGIILILDIVAVVLIQNLAIYKITDVSKEGLSQIAYFEDCEITKATEIVTSDTYHIICYVEYVDKAKEERIVCLEKFPHGLFARYRLKSDTDCAVDEDGMILYENGETLSKVTGLEYVNLSNPTDAFSKMILQSRQFTKNLAFIYIVSVVVLLGIEFFFYSVFHRLFRS